MHATWSDINFEESASRASKDARYDPNDFLALIVSMEFVNDNDCDSDSDDEFTNEQRVEFLSNLVIEHEKLIKSNLKDHDILEAHRNKIDMLNVDKTNLLEKIRFLESKHHCFLEKNNALTQEIRNNKPLSSMNEKFHPGTKVLNEIIDKCKTHDNKRVLGYINKDETLNVEIVFFKCKNETPNPTESCKKTSLCIHYKKIGHTQFRCYTRFLERFKYQTSRLMNDFNSIKMNILNNEKGNKTS